MKKIYVTMLLTIAAIAHSQVLFEDNFLAYTSNIQLSGQGNWTNNSSTFGGGACAGSACTNTTVIDATMAYANYGSSTKAIAVKPNQDAVGIPLSTAMVMPANGNVIYYAFLINVSSVPASTPADVFRALSGGSFNTALRMQIKNAAGGFTIGVSKNTGTNTFTSTVYPLNTTHLVVLKYTMNSSSNTDDVISLFVNPASSAEPSTADLTFSSGNDYGTSLNMDRFLIRTNTAAVPTMSFAYPKVAKNYTNLFSQTLAVSNHNTKQDSYILENPVGSDLRIKLGDHFDRGLTIVSIIDASGKIVKKVNYQEKISVSDLSKGLYFISVSNDNKTTKLKFLKR